MLSRKLLDFVRNWRAAEIAAAIRAGEAYLTRAGVLHWTYGGKRQVRHLPLDLAIEVRWLSKSKQ